MKLAHTTPATKHSTDCHMSFGRPQPSTGCPRCIELANGAAPRQQAWRKQYAQFRADSAAAIAAHFASHAHRSGGCGPVCTFGDN